MLQIYNTLTKKIEEFKPVKKDTAHIYNCGPTVYDYAHVGNLRAYIFADILRRTLETRGFSVLQVMNITDVGHLVADSDTGEEKIEVAARRSGKSAWEIAEFYTNVFLRDISKLNLLVPQIMPKATEHIKEQIELVEILEQKGFTYRTSDGIYFDTSKLPDYGILTGQKLEEKEAGARVEVNPEKKNPWDFVLWKFSPKDYKREMEWESPWGIGFPGWHIECSAMSRKYLGQPFDVHTGGIDHVSIHHTNEIAQSEAAYGLPLANYWMHSEFLTIDGKRMGKSEGNLKTISELEELGFSPLAYRYFVLGAHYRSKLNFTTEALLAAEHALWNLYDTVRNWDEPQDENSEFQKKFDEAMDDDLNTPQALAVLWDLVKSDTPSGQKAKTILNFDKILGLNLQNYVSKKLEIPDEVQKLVFAREDARKEKEWQKSDDIRKQIEDVGFTIEDTAGGSVVKEKRKDIKI